FGGWIKDHRLIKVQVLFGKFAVVDQQFQVGELVLGVGLAQTDAYGSGGVEVLGFVEIELIVVALAFLLENDHLVMGLGNRTFEIGAGAGDFLPRRFELLALRVELLALRVKLGLDLLPTRVRLLLQPTGMQGTGRNRLCRSHSGRRFWRTQYNSRCLRRRISDGRLRLLALYQS